ncbi:cytochrome P450 4c21 isoform X2 [Solenopsis invicta]|uniref:cytochrome P450 4c21 isoform X2 n=1 Tax=Solenopsis invicta TaxID=13686 RepID=UPI00193E3647|nr:cytochrome P450 4c21 isoform X2 [Solenopsis invicta]XP_039303867.1 cytochrome P450 4c21 isoform X2 [Solenopsis invicta]
MVCYQSCALPGSARGNYIRSLATVNTLPGPVRLPLIGTSYIFLQQKSEDFLSIIMQMCEKFSSPFQFWIGPKLVFVIYEPDQIKTVLQSHFCLDKSMMYNAVKPIFGSGLLTAPAHIWTGDRKMIAPIFQTVMLREFVDIFVQEASILTEELEKIGHNGNEIFFLKPSLERYTLKIAFGTMIGIKVKENILNEIVEALGRMKKIIGARFRNAFLIPDFIFNFTSMGSTQRKTIIFVQSLIDKVIQQWTNESNTTNVNDGITRKRLVNILMSSTHNKKFTEKEIFYHLITMLITASDTIAVTMYFVIFVLANFSEIQEKVYKELLEIYGTKTPKAAPVKYEDLQRMNYLERVIKETLRIFPTGPVIAREVTEDVKIGLLIFKNLLHLLLIFFEIFVIIKHE